MSLLEGLDERQHAAVVAGQGLVRVMAGAGTGKTRVLTTRLAYLATTMGVAPCRITATTFTNKAAREIMERAALLGGEAVAGARLCTLHALAARLLRRHWSAAGFASANWTIADEDEARAMMATAVDASGVFGEGAGNVSKDLAKERRDFIGECLDRIARWKENGLSIRMVRDPARPRRGQKDEDIARVYVAYQEELAARNMVDFGDLTLRAVELLEDRPDILEREAGQVEYLMVDEAQDTNRIQLRLIALLVSVHGNLMIVGDDDQSLYSFRGSIENLMERIAIRLEALAARGLTDVMLITNRRCTDEILAPANLLVDYNTRAEPKVLKSGRRGEPVAVKGYPTEVMEAEALAARVQELIDQGVAPSQIAVLVRSKHVAEPIGQALVKHRIPHEMQAGTGFLERTEVRDVLAYLKLAFDPTLDLCFARIIARPTRGLGAAALEAILKLARGRGVPIHEACLMLADSPALKADARDEARRLGDRLATLAMAAQNAESSEDIVRYVLDVVGYAEWQRQQKEPPKTLRSSFDGLLDMARAQPSFIDFLTDLSLLADPEEKADTGVHVGTLHGAKGLEWDYVFLPAFEDGVLPSRRALEEARSGDPEDPWNVETFGGIEEERRLAHVGFTRARKAVVVSFALVRGRGPLRGPSKASRFLREAELEVPRVTQATADVKGMRTAKGPAKKKAAFW